MRFITVRFSLCIATGIALVAGAGCSKEQTTGPTETKTPDGASSAPSGVDAAQRKNALVRFVNADYTGGRWDLWFGEQKAFGNDAFRQVSAYIELPGERRDFKLRPAGQDVASPSAFNSERLSDGQHYTAVVFRTKDGVDLKIFADELAAPAPGTAKVRVIHGATALGTVDVRGGSNQDQKQKLFSNVKFKSATGFKEVDPSAPLAIDENQHLVLIPVRAEPEKLASILLIGPSITDVMTIEDQVNP